MVHNHVKSAKHQAGKKRLAAKEVHDIDIAEALKASDEVAHRDPASRPASVSCEGCHSISTGCCSSQQVGALP